MARPLALALLLLAPTAFAEPRQPGTCGMYRPAPERAAGYASLLEERTRSMQASMPISVGAARPLADGFSPSQEGVTPYHWILGLNERPPYHSQIVSANEKGEAGLQLYALDGARCRLERERGGLKLSQNIGGFINATRLRSNSQVQADAKKRDDDTNELLGRLERATADVEAMRSIYQTFGGRLENGLPARGDLRAGANFRLVPR